MTAKARECRIEETLKPS